MIYLDNAATTRPCEAAITAAVNAARDSFGNVSSLHGMGIKSEKLLSAAKACILKRLCCKGELYFTSGATESNNLALFGIADAYKRRGRTIISTAAEHPSVARTLDKLSEMRYNVIRLSPKDAPDSFEEYVADAVTEDNLDAMVRFAKDFAAKAGVIVAITGAIDLVADGDTCYVIRNGRPEMGKITGTGCQLSGMMTAFLVANQDNKLEAAAAAVCAMGLAGEIGWSHMRPEDGNSTYRNRIIDAISHMDADTLREGAKYEVR